MLKWKKSRPIMCLTEEIIERVLNAHNDYRQIHNAPPLKYSFNVGELAQKHALKLAESGSLEHSEYVYNEEPIGENLARWKCDDGVVSDGLGLEAVKSWYSEINEYNFDLNEFQPKAGHFTQLVWKSSEFLGFGLAKSSDGFYYAVAFYYPAGNCGRQYQNNVDRSDGDSLLDSQLSNSSCS